MNITLHPQTSRRGVGTMMFMVMIALIVGSGLVYFLASSSQENNLVGRSQDWGSAMILAEAGIEEGMALINNSGWPNNNTYSSDGWTFNATNGVYSITRTLNTNIGSYTVYVTNLIAGPNILSVGSAFSNDSSMNSNRIRRAVLVSTRSSNPFLAALTLQDTVDMNGNRVTIDSYDSSNPLYSYWLTNRGFGIYTNTDTTPNIKRRAGGNVATDGALVGIVSVGNANVYGIVNTGPGGTVNVGSQGSVGDLTWVNNGTRGIKPGWARDDMNVLFTDVALPDTNWVTWPDNLDITNSGYFTMNQISANMKIKATNVILHLPNGINFSGNKVLTIETNASVQIFAGGAIDVGGNGAINNSTKHPSQLVIWGLPSLTYIKLAGNGAFWGAIYAPEAVVEFKGSGSSGGYYGALMAYSIKLTGTSTFSYDESLKNLFGGAWTVTSWKEVTGY